MTQDYETNARNRTEELRCYIRQQDVPLAERSRRASDIATDYVAAQDVYFGGIKAEGKTPPIQYRNSDLMDELADVILQDDLTWSHPDKMSIVEYPILSDSQQHERNLRDLLLEDVFTGKDDVTIGRKRSADGDMVRIYDYMTPKHDNGLVPAEHIELYTALDNAGLTDRQRQAIVLLYYEGLTQEDAADVMGVSRSTLRVNEARAVNKLREFTSI